MCKRGASLNFIRMNSQSAISTNVMRRYSRSFLSYSSCGNHMILSNIWLSINDHLFNHYENSLKGSKVANRSNDSTFSSSSSIRIFLLFERFVDEANKPEPSLSHMRLLLSWRNNARFDVKHSQPFTMTSSIGSSYNRWISPIWYLNITE